MKHISAVILCAGLGTRLRPLTDKIPKPLIKVGKVAVLDRILSYLYSFGLRKFVINSHHLPLHFMKFQYLVTFSPEFKLRGTAGALKLMESVLSDTFIVVNGDTLTNVDLKDMLKMHESFHPIMTVFTKKDLIHSGGVYIFDKRILDYIPKTRPYSIHEDLIPKLIKKKELIVSYMSDDAYYFDIGTPKGLAKARKFYGSIHNL